MTDSPDSAPAPVLHLSEEDRFEIGGENLLADVPILSESPQSNIANGGLEEIRIRLGTLLKTENVSFLLGAGASVACGGITIGSLPISIELALHNNGVSDCEPADIQNWLSLFYAAARCVASSDIVPTTAEDIQERHRQLADGKEKVDHLEVNLEQILATLHRWRKALPRTAERMCISGDPRVVASAEDLVDCLTQVTRSLAQHCQLPKWGKDSGLSDYKVFVRKTLTRPLNLKRVNLFTLNYDTLIEQATDAEGVVLLDGFVGTTRRVFRPESYERDLYFPAETTEGRVHRFDRVLHLYKLHGSISWISEQPTLDNPYGVSVKSSDLCDSDRLLIFPTPAKFTEMLGMPYAELFRRFASTVTRPQSVLFVVGYGFGDEHVNAIIRQALAVPSFTLVVIDPNPSSQFVCTLRKQKDRRVWIVQGSQLGTFENFVRILLPDLRDEDIRKRVIDTHRALGRNTPYGDGANVD
ncbi:MAG: SIR2 family protein [Gemmatimonadetes bacterium]|nr:SIR2 family protein [Gemmatimonadota bacterium]